MECTVNRVGDAYCDQLERNGHARRIEDLDLFAELGLRTLRYPVLWERVAPAGLASADWSWPDARLPRLRALGIRPIVGLVHHGSGPRTTSLLEASFVEGLTAYAAAVAERYPWLDAYTPVNEPLTTARFSALYGHWYPHARDPRAFARALLIECRATVLAMRAIRRVNPRAQLVQTEDLGKTHSTPRLGYQAQFDNERRWLTFDLLAGRLGPGTPMWDYFRWLGVEAAEVQWFRDHPCPPDVLGLNYYVTSERFLDHRLTRYPADTHGGNGRDRYADVSAVRVPEGIAGPATIFREAWDRYGLPLAVTEAHLAAAREDQMRWFWEVWRSAEAVRGEGVDLRAVTAWSLLGSFDWNSLLCRCEGFYETGVFDARGARPRPTAIAELIRDLVRGRDPSHPALAAPGWWRRPERVAFPAAVSPVSMRAGPPTPELAAVLAAAPAVSAAAPPRPLLIAGAGGTLGRALALICDWRGLPYVPLDHARMDIADPASVEAAMAAHRPWAVINAAGYLHVDRAEHDAEACHRVNALGPAVLAEACGRYDAALATFSSDLVFDGGRQQPYVEADAVAPLNHYGRTKAEAERRVLETLPGALIVRTSVFFGPWDERNFVTAALRALAAGERFPAAADATVSPTFVPDLVQAVLDLLADRERGVWHVATPGAVTWVELARQAATRAGLDAAGIDPRATRDFGFAAPRPLYSVLGTQRAVVLPPLDHALDRHVRETRHRWPGRN